MRPLTFCKTNTYTMKRRLVVIPLFLCCHFLSYTVAAQDKPDDDSLYYVTAVTNAVDQYRNTIGEQAGILNGRMNIPYIMHFENAIPYFLSEKFTIGNLRYDGVSYEDIPLLYDQFNPMLIMLMNFGRLQLINEKVEQFSIAGHNFVRLEKNAGMADGFYEVVYNGNITLVKYVTKKLREDIQSGEVLRYLDQKDYYYIHKNGTYHLVRNKKEVLNVLQDHKQQLQEYIKKNKLNLKRNWANAIVQLAGYYDKLSS